jgi:hypothetical protein
LYLVAASTFSASKEKKVAALVSLAAHAINQSYLVTNEAEKKELLQQATHFFSKAEGIDHTQPLSWIGRSLFLMHLSLTLFVTPPRLSSFPL